MPGENTAILKKFLEFKIYGVKAAAAVLKHMKSLLNGKFKKFQTIYYRRYNI